MDNNFSMTPQEIMESAKKNVVCVAKYVCTPVGYFFGHVTLSYHRDLIPEDSRACSAGFIVVTDTDDGFIGELKDESSEGLRMGPCKPRDSKEIGELFGFQFTYK